MQPRVLTVVGARPNVVKVAPVWHAARELGAFSMRVLHAGQHYVHLEDAPRERVA